MGSRGARSEKGLRPGALKSALEAHATRPSPLAGQATALLEAQLLFSTRGYEGLSADQLDVAVLHLWDVGACWAAWPDWAEKRFPHLVKAGLFVVQRYPHGLETALATPGMEVIAANAGRAIDAAPAPRQCGCVICAAAKIGQTIPMQFEQARGAL